MTLGNALTDIGELDEADDLLADAARHFAGESKWTEYAQAQISRGRLQAERGRTQEALEFFSSLKDIELPSPLRSQVLNNLGLLNRLVGNLGDAIVYLSEDVTLCEAVGDTYGAAVARLNLASALSDAGRHAESASHAFESANSFEQCGREDLAREARAFGSQHKP